MRFNKKIILIATVTFVIVFGLVCYCLLQALASLGDSQKVAIPVQNVNNLGELKKILNGFQQNLRLNYRRKTLIDQDESWKENLNVQREIDLKSLWSLVNQQIDKNNVIDLNFEYLGTALKALRTSKIIFADVDSRGSQLKLLLVLEGDQKVVFKPQWYPIDQVITGVVYSGKDRFNSEIIAFYLSAILDFRSAPLATSRYLDLETEIIPVASTRLKDTIIKVNDSWCVYGQCHYCRITEPACPFTPAGLHGAIILHLPQKLKVHRSPWSRKYQGHDLAKWQTDMEFCNKIKKQIHNETMLDLIDVAIFDFLIQNGDRHHYETANGKIVLIDNGKGFGNAAVHHLDILAPLYQCCVIRFRTWERLKSLSGGTLSSDLLTMMGAGTQLITEAHLKALEERLLFVYATVEFCFSRNPKYKVLQF